MALQTRLNVSLSAKQTSAADLGAGEANIAKQVAIALANGVAAGQADLAWADSDTLAASATRDIDLSGVLTGVLATPAVVSFVKVRALVVVAAAGNTNNVVVGGAAANAWVGPFGAATHTIAVRPGGVLVLGDGQADLAGYPVVAGTGDQLRITNGGGGTAVTYDVAIIGTSA